MNEEAEVRKRPRSLLRVVLQAVGAWRRERRMKRRMKRLINEIARRGNDHLLDDVGVGRAAFCQSQEDVPDTERARRFLWML